AIHNHDDRYYKKGDADGRFFNVSGDTVAGESTFEDIVNIDSYLDFGGDGRLQGNNAGALEILDNAGTNNGELQLHKLTVTNIEIDGEIDQRNVNDLAVKDQYISLNYGTTGTPTLNAGLRVDQGTQTDQFWLFDQGKMDWGKKSGSGGSFDKALFKSDLFPNDPIQQLGASDNVDFNNLDLSGTLDVAGIADFQDNVIIRDQIGSENFFPGFGGNGWSHRKEGSSYALDTDRVTIREYLWAYEFIINKISSIGGSEILSPANGKIESVGSGEITISDPVNDTNKVTEFAVDDLIMMKEAGVD